MNKKFRLITCIDVDYPPLLRHINYYPAGLYISGKMNMERFFLSVVGTRKCSRYGETHTKNMIKDLREYPFTIVSGLAHGIDTVAHWSAVQNNLQTIAVLGYGFDHLPRTKFKLVREILEKNGAIISEYPPDRQGAKYTFPERNRIIAGISPVTIITEAPERSGALITANIAFDANRDILAIPGNIDRSNSQGCNELIKNPKAEMLITSADILKLYRITPKKNQTEIQFDFPPDQKEILKRLSRVRPKNMDQLIEEVEKDPSETMYIIGILEINKHIKKIPGGYIII